MKEKTHSTNFIFTLILLGIFALSALLVAVLGAQVYGRTAEKMDSNYNMRTSLVYLTEKIRQTPGKDIDIKDIDGNEALVLKQTTNGREYESWIWTEDGKLREVLIPGGKKVKSNDGQEIMDIKDFDLEMNDGLLRITVSDKSGKEQSVIISADD